MVSVRLPELSTSDADADDLRQPTNGTRRGGEQPRHRASYQPKRGRPPVQNRRATRHSTARHGSKRSQKTLRDGFITPPPTAFKPQQKKYGMLHFIAPSLSTSRHPGLLLAHLKLLALDSRIACKSALSKAALEGLSGSGGGIAPPAPPPPPAPPAPIPLIRSGLDCNLARAGDDLSMDAGRAGRGGGGNRLLEEERTRAGMGRERGRREARRGRGMRPVAYTHRRGSNPAA